MLPFANTWELHNGSHGCTHHHVINNLSWPRSNVRRFTGLNSWHSRPVHQLVDFTAATYQESMWASIYFLHGACIFCGMVHVFPIWSHLLGKYLIAFHVSTPWKKTVDHVDNFSVLDEWSRSTGSDHTPDPLQWGIWPQTATLLRNGSGDPNGVLGQQSRPWHFTLKVPPSKAFKTEW